MNSVLLKSPSINRVKCVDIRQSFDIMMKENPQPCPHLWYYSRQVPDKTWHTATLLAEAHGHSVTHKHCAVSTGINSSSRLLLSSLLLCSYVGSLLTRVCKTSSVTWRTWLAEGRAFMVLKMFFSCGEESATAWSEKYTLSVFVVV